MLRARGRTVPRFDGIIYVNVLVPAHYQVPYSRLGPYEKSHLLLRLAARAHGVGTADDLADYDRMPVREARLRLAELVEAGDLREVRVEGWRQPISTRRRACRAGSTPRACCRRSTR